MKRDVILFLGGGAMAGVFGAGIVTRLQEANVYDKIHSIYSSSAGAFNMAYFLSKQTSLGSTIYWEDLPGRLITPFKGFIGIIQRIWNRYIKKIHYKSISNAINIDVLMKVAKTKKKINVKTILKNPIKGYIKVFDTKENKVKYLDIKPDVFKKLYEAVSLAPYYFPNPKNRYIDGGGMDLVNFEELRKIHKGKKIIICLNYNEKRIGTKLDGLRKYFEGIVINFMYPRRGLYKYFYSVRKRFLKDLKLVSEDKKALLIHPPRKSFSKQSTSNPKRLKETYKLGKKEAEKILSFIKP